MGGWGQANNQGPQFWATVWLLLRSARRRFGGRKARQQELMHNRGGRSTDWGTLGTLLGVLFMAGVHALAVGTLWYAVTTGERVSVEQSGKVVVSRDFLRMIKLVNSLQIQAGRPREATEDLVFSAEAADLARHDERPKAEEVQKLKNAYIARGPDGFVTKKSASPGFRVFARQRWNRVPAMLGSLVLLWWALMLMCQGEGLELDLQRRRHPMWEWLFSHPVPIGAVFLAEMLAPLAANPVYWTAPVFVAGAYGLMYGPLLGLLAGVVIGLPLTLAAGCIGKALEIGVMLRVSPRQRGAVIGVMSWLGYASMMLLFLGSFVASKISGMALRWMMPLTKIPWPWLSLFLGRKPGGDFSFALGMVTCWAASALLLSIAVGVTVWGTQKGLAGAFGAATTGAPRKAANFGREPLYRKEMLWFLRDRSAIVQSILIPLTVAGLQAFNLRGIMRMAQGEWNYLCGAAIVFGTYFLWVLGPKSLASEGTALWIALTWPRGLESLLKAKAWLWAMLSSTLVAVILIYAAVLYPHEAWKIALVGVAWVLFGRSMAEKAVTLVSVTSESGEVQKLRGGTRAGAQLGMLTFAIGVLTQQWNIAVMGIVYSYLTAAAMWQNFRARLPYLYDPWSEEMPDPPTLVQAMVAISVMVELGALIAGVTIAFGARPPVAQTAGYAFSAVLVGWGTMRFMDNRGVTLRNVWVWDKTPKKPVPKYGFSRPALGLTRGMSFDEMMAEPERVPWWQTFGEVDAKFVVLLLQAACAGFALGGVALGYGFLLEHLPAMAPLLRKAQDAAANYPEWHKCYAIMAIGFAPFAEEYLFRGLLFRALDREWGGWKAVLGSAAFFVIYHPPLAWPMVFCLGAVNAWMFKKTGRLAPAVVLHMIYNAVVLSR